VNNELERIQKETVVTKLKLLFRHLPRALEGQRKLRATLVRIVVVQAEIQNARQTEGNVERAFLSVERDTRVNTGPSVTMRQLRIYC
jgi:hypothetical protein